MALTPTGKLMRGVVHDELGTDSKHAISQKIVTDELAKRVPTTRKINGKALTADVTLVAGEVGAYTKAEVDTRVNARVPTSRKVNGKVLTADVTLVAGDVNAYTKAEVDSRISNFVPTSRKVNGKVLSADISLNASDVGAWPIGQAVASANLLATARSINGTAFNGSADITTAKWGTARNITIGSTTKSIDGSANFSFSLDDIGVYSKAAVDGTPRIHSGAGDPPNSLGKDGDIYIKY